MPRAGVSVPHATGNLIPHRWFVRIDLGTPLRYTNHHANITLDIGDGNGSQTWVAYDFNVGTLPQSTPKPLDVTFLDIADVDKVWSAIAFGGATFRETVIAFFLVQYDPTDFRNNILTVLGKPKMYEGRMSGADLDEKGRINVVINPHAPSWSVTSLRVIGTSRCVNDYKDPDTCQYVGALPSCARTRLDCIAHGNSVHFAGDDLCPPATLVIPFGRSSVGPGTSGSATAPVPVGTIIPPPKPWTGGRVAGGGPIPRVTARPPVRTVGPRTGIPVPPTHYPDSPPQTLGRTTVTVPQRTPPYPDSPPEKK